MHWEARHEHAYGPFPDVTVSAHFSGCPALTDFNLTTALPRDQWAAAFAAPDIDNIQQMLFHYSLLPRLAISLLVGAGLGLVGVLFQQVLRNPLAEPTTLGVATGLSWGSPSPRSGPCRER